MQCSTIVPIYCKPGLRFHKLGSCRCEYSEYMFTILCECFHFVLTMNRFYFRFSLYSKFNNKQWMFFCEDTTEIYLKGLLEVLATFDSSKVSLQLFFFDFFNENLFVLLPIRVTFQQNIKETFDLKIYVCVILVIYRCALKNSCAGKFPDIC